MKPCSCDFSIPWLTAQEDISTIMKYRIRLTIKSSAAADLEASEAISVNYYYTNQQPNKNKLNTGFLFLNGDLHTMKGDTEENIHIYIWVNLKQWFLAWGISHAKKETKTGIRI